MCRKAWEITLKVNSKWVKTAGQVLFVIYLIVLSYFLFFSERYGRAGTVSYRYNLVLFKEIKRFITYRKELGLENFIINIFGNVFAFAPFGFILPIISRKNRNIFSIVLLSFEFTLAIELIQLIFRVGIFDVDDIFMNTLGGFVGGVVFFICYWIYKRGGEKIEKKIEKKRKS